jgi:hypothetical protein
MNEKIIDLTHDKTQLEYKIQKNNETIKYQKVEIESKLALLKNSELVRLLNHFNIKKTILKIEIQFKKTIEDMKNEINNIKTDQLVSYPNPNCFNNWIKSNNESISNKNESSSKKDSLNNDDMNNLLTIKEAEINRLKSRLDDH